MGDGSGRGSEKAGKRGSGSRAGGCNSHLSACTMAWLSFQATSASGLGRRKLYVVDLLGYE